MVTNHKYFSNEYLSMEIIDKVKVISVGKSLYIPLPASLCSILEIVKGTGLNVYKEGDRITYERSEQ